MSRWFRYYDDALNDPKVQRLPGDLFKAWVNLLCLTSKNRGRPFSAADVAFALRLSDARAAALVDDFVKRALLDPDGDGFVSHGWAERQRASDVSNERVSRFRKRRRGGGDDDTGNGDGGGSNDAGPVTGNDGGNVTDAVAATPPEKNRTDQIRETSSLRSDVARSRAAPQGTRLPDDWSPTLQGWSFAKDALGQERALQELEKFRDFWRAKPGAGGRKSDWDATWRNWIRRASETRAPPGSAPQPRPGSREDRQERLANVLQSFDPRTRPHADDRRPGEGHSAAAARLLPPGERH